MAQHLLQNRPRFRSRQLRRGNILVLSAVMMVMTAGFVALAVDVGSLYVARCELQRAADAAALSAAWDLVDEAALRDDYDAQDLEEMQDQIRETAVQFASWNKVLSNTLQIAASDIQIGYTPNPADPTSPLQTTSSNAPNTVRVHVRKSEVLNGPVSFGFARVLGFCARDVEAQATAALLTEIDGFRAPRDGGNLGFLPIALDEGSWDALRNGTGTDNYKWDPATNSVKSGKDGILEINLYPGKTGSPGNRGTVDIGGDNNSTNVLSRQIRDGVTPADLAHHGGELKLNSQGQLNLNGDTGISAGIKDDLQSIVGEPRIIPIFRQVSGPGNNATYTIVRFVGVRVLAVKLTGSQTSKYVYVQPAAMVARGTIPSTTPGRSNFVYSNVWLVK